MTADVYLWLAGVFAREATTEGLAAYRSRDGRAFLLHLTETAPAADGAFALLALADERADTEAFAFELAGAFSRLFLGAGGRSAVPPYESVYTSPEGRLFQQATTDMEGLLREHGLSVAGTPEPADHIAVELEFLAQLTAEAAEGSEIAAARRRVLLAEHLLVWAPQFCTLCIERDRSGYYAAAARVLEGLLRVEAESPGKDAVI